MAEKAIGERSRLYQPSTAENDDDDDEKDSQTTLNRNRRNQNTALHPVISLNFSSFTISIPIWRALSSLLPASSPASR
jgi:hypothetical protein